MRFEAIDLVRYGHFSSRHLRFPESGHDFHLILGRNEAGKSTLRQAFRDLLFGIPMATSMSFLHPGTELELGARLSGGPGELVFGRRRKRNGGLVDAAGDPLAADALRPWLGDVTEAFYERMFGLDHRRLEQGGQAMLQASDNVDSVLFQAAAGVSALNGVLDTLRQEADGLWAPRRSRERAWYAAADRLSEAESVLKSSTVRPSAWGNAQRESRRLEEACAAAEAEHASLLAQVRELEHLRRLAPLLAQIRQYEGALAEETGEGGAPAAGTLHREHRADIQQLDENRQRVADHKAGIERCTSRIETLWGQLSHVLRQLGQPVPAANPDSLDGLASALPPRPLRREIEQLLQEGRQIRSQYEAAMRALEDRRAELVRLHSEIESLPAVAIAPSLRHALEAAEVAGDVEAMRDAARRNHAREEISLRRRLDALAQPGIVLPEQTEEAVDWLVRMEPWHSGFLMEQSQRRQHFQGEIDALDKRARDAELELQAAALELEQFRRSHQAVSRDEVVAARRERDAVWEAFARSESPLGPQAGRYETLVLHADTLADRHLEAVGAAARLQSLQHEHERRVASLDGLRTARARAAQTLAQYETEWAQACGQRGLPVLPPAELQSWLTGREAALTAHESRLAAGAEAAALEARHDVLLSELVAALEAEGQVCEKQDPGGRRAEAPPAPSLSVARGQARSLLHQVQQAQARRQALLEQCSRIEPLLPVLEEDCRRRRLEQDDWQARRRDALARAGLAVESQAAYVEAALALLADADDLVGRLRETHAERGNLAAELGRFHHAASQLAALLQDAAFDSASTEAHVRRWAGELEQASAEARLREETRQRLAELNERLLQEGEGRSREQIESALKAVDISTLSQQAEVLSAALEQAAATRSALAVEREQARKVLESVAGGDAAAQAEARRQEALADMAEIAERYVQLHAEHRLLEWVTERYRERRQGPLLARAGQMFADLTLGAHAGLVVDSEAAVLHARRADGRLVPLEGLSDGTRDQLYLALRLAALELYLDHAAPMPFIADDLFVNYDDERAMAGLRKLADVSRHTQVIFLTHHAHMVELARVALADKMHRIEL